MARYSFVLSCVYRYYTHLIHPVKRPFVTSYAQGLVIVTVHPRRLGQRIQSNPPVGGYPECKAKVITPFADHLGEKDIHFREV